MVFGCIEPLLERISTGSVRNFLQKTCSEFSEIIALRFKGCVRLLYRRTKVFVGFGPAKFLFEQFELSFDLAPSGKNVQEKVLWPC